MSDLPPTMRALEVQAFDGPEAMKLVERPLPEPDEGEVLIRVEAAGVNFADVMQTRGLYQGGPQPPYIAGLEVSGEVVAGTDRMPLGSRLMAPALHAFAEYAAVPLAVAMPLPAGWSAEMGAAFPIQWLTAHACLRLCGRLEPGETVLIHAAAGGVGQAAVQLAKHYGATVIGTASTEEKLEQVRALGADQVINYREQNFERVLRKQGCQVDLILEMVGGRTFRRNLRAVRPYGRIVVFGAASAEQANVSNVELIFQPVELIGYHLSVIMTKRRDLFAGQVDEIQSLIARNVIVPAPPTSYPLAEGPQALADLESRNTTGKLVLIP